MKQQFKQKSRKRAERLLIIRAAAHPVKDALLIEFMLLYEQTINQLASIATCHLNTVDVPNEDGTGGRIAVPALDNRQFREEVARIMDL